MKALQSGFDALAITVGTKLMPPLQAVVGAMLAHKGATVAAVGALAGLLAATVAVSVAMKAAAAATMLWSGVTRGVAAVKGVFETVALKAMYMRDAFATAGGGVRGLRAAFSSLGAVAKGSVVVAGLALLAVGVQKLAAASRGAPPDVDKLTTSLKNLAATGKFAGELKSTFGDMDGFVAKLNAMKKAQSDMDKGSDWADSIAGLGPLVDKVAPKIDDLVNGTHSLGAMKDDFASFDQSMADFAGGEHAKEAADEFKKFQTALKGAGYSTKDVAALFPQYTAAVAGVAAEQELTAKSMGLFGKAAVSTQKDLDAEALSAKGLEQSIMALNAVHRGAFDAETAFQQAISDTKKALKENGKTLDIHTEAGRRNRDVASQMAAKTEDLVDKKLKEKVAWDEVDRTYKQGRQSIIDFGMAVYGSKKKAEALADQLLKAPKIPPVKFKVDKKAATSDLAAFNAAVKKTPGTKSVTLKALSASAEKVLESLGYKVTHLKGGSVKVTAATGRALSGIRNVSGAISALDGRTARTWVITTIKTNYVNSLAQRGQSVHDAVGATGGLYTGSSFRHGYADGGLVSGPGTGTSDEVSAPWLSNGEFVMKKAAVDRYGEKFMQRLNAGMVDMPRFAKGGKVKLTKAQQKAKEAAKAERDARHDAMGDLTISHFGHMAGYKRSEFGNALGKPESVGSLTSALNQWRSIIMKSTHGSTENRLLKQLDATGRKLIGYEKALTKVTASLDKAKDKLNSLKDAAASLKDGVKSSLISSANITKGAGADSTTTLGSIRGQMTVSRDKVVAFASALKRLKAKGYSKSIIQQVAEAGVDGGGLETAGALLEASSSEVSSINSVQGQIEKAAGSAGKTTADAVYGAAIKAQTKVVEKLTRQQHSLQKSMEKLTKAMEKALERAFGKKASGGIVGAAATGGIRGGLTLVGEHEPELLDLPIGSRVISGPDTRRRLGAQQMPWASMLNTSRRPAAPAGGASVGDGQPIIIQLRLGAKDFGELWVDTGRKQVRARGSIEATLQPPRGR
jgi:hypothetical protein